MPSYNPQKHHRRSIRLQGYDYTQAGVYFITIVIYQRENLFGEIVNGEMHLNALGKMAQREWERLPQRFKTIELDEFIIMPNHAHGIIVITVIRRGTAETGNNANELLSRRAPTQPFDQPNPGTAGLEQDVEALMSRRAPTGNDDHIPTREQFGKPVPGSIPTILRSYKSAVTLRAHRMREGTTGPVWQRDYYERVIRNERELNATRQYIQDNPLNWEKDQENPITQ